MTDQPAPVQAYAVAVPQKRIIGDRWDVSLTFTVGGAPVDLAASPPVAEFYAGGPLPPLMLSVGNGVAVTGQNTAIFTLGKSVTAALSAQVPRPGALPVRLAVGLLDSSGQQRTYLIVPFIPVDPRSACS